MHRVFAFIILVLIFLTGFWLTQKFLVQTAPSIVNNTFVQKSGCDEQCQEAIRKEVQRVIGSATPVPRTPSPVPAPSGGKMTQFVSLDGAFATTSTDWVDVPGTDVTFDLTKNYSKNALVNFQATLKVSNGNGQAFARLFDKTHGIAVTGSEISTTANSDFVTAYSGPLNLWAGQINYRAQIKSLNSYSVSYTGGKIKIEY